MVGRWPYLVAGVLAALGVVLIIVGGCLVPYLDDVIIQRIKSHVLPSNDSDSYEEWKNWSRFEPVYRRFHFFDVLNPKEIVENGDNVTVNETGSYVYRVNFERRNLKFTSGNSRLSFDLYKTFTFERNLSSGAEDDNLTAVNLPILNLATRLRFENRTVQRETALEIRRLGEGLFARVRVSDILWGYNNTNLETLLIFLKGRFGIHPLNDSTYGLFYQKAQPKKTTYEGSYEVNTEDLKSVWKITKWNGQRSLNVWNSNASNRIDGTDGSAWPPNVDKSATEWLFDSDWCRSFRLSAFDPERRKVGNLGTYGYYFSNATLSYSAAAAAAEGNRGFCQPTPKQNGSCLDDGVLNVTSCKDNVPLLLSQPHFLGADVKYITSVSGLHPNQTEHQTTFDIEPMSGEVVKAARKMQLNAYLMKLTSFPNTTRFSNDTVVPVVWTDEVYSMTETERQYLADLNYLRRKYDVTKYTLIGVGAFLLVVAIVIVVVVYLIRRCRAAKEGLDEVDERQPLLH